MADGFMAVVPNFQQDLAYLPTHQAHPTAPQAPGAILMGGLPALLSFARHSEAPNSYADSCLAHQRQSVLQARVLLPKWIPQDFQTSVLYYLVCRRPVRFHREAPLHLLFLPLSLRPNFNSFMWGTILTKN